MDVYIRINLIQIGDLNDGAAVVQNLRNLMGHISSVFVHSEENTAWLYTLLRKGDTAILQFPDDPIALDYLIGKSVLRNFRSCNAEGELLIPAKLSSAKAAPLCSVSV